MDSLKSMIKYYLEQDNISTFLNNYNIQQIIDIKKQCDELYIKKHNDLLYKFLNIPKYINIDQNEFILNYTIDTCLNNTIEQYKYLYVSFTVTNGNVTYFDIYGDNTIIDKNNINIKILNWNSINLQNNIIYLQYHIIDSFINNINHDLCKCIVRTNKNGIIYNDK